MPIGRDQDPIGNHESWMTSVESAVKVAENVRLNASDKYEFIMQEFAKPFLLRDGMINYIIDNADNIYERTGQKNFIMIITLRISARTQASHMNGMFDLSLIIHYFCEYIQNDADIILVYALKTSLLGAACGSDPSADCDISLDLHVQFNRCASNYEINSNWQDTIGSQIILWLRFH